MKICCNCDETNIHRNPHVQTFFKKMAKSATFGKKCAIFENLTKSQCKSYSNLSGLEIIDIFDFEGHGHQTSIVLSSHFERAVFIYH